MDRAYFEIETERNVFPQLEKKKYYFHLNEDFNCIDVYKLNKRILRNDTITKIGYAKKDFNENTINIPN